MMSMIFDPLRFIADHAGMALVDAISEAYRQGQQDAQRVPDTNDGDTISRYAAIDEICDIRCGKSRFDCESYKNRNYISDCDYIRSLLNLPSAQPEIVRCEDCEHLKKWRSEESAKKFGQIYECARNVLNCPKSEDFCSRAKRREG